MTRHHQCVPGFVPLNHTFCLPCPAGWECARDSLVAACRAGEWSGQGEMLCRPCTATCNAERSVVLRPCAATHDALCHMCPYGFGPANGTTCRVDPLDPYTVFNVINFLVLVLEILIMVSCYQCIVSRRQSSAPVVHYTPLV